MAPILLTMSNDQAGDRPRPQRNMKTTALSLIVLSTAGILALPAPAVSGNTGSPEQNTKCSWVLLSSSGPTETYQQVCRQGR